MICLQYCLLLAGAVCYVRQAALLHAEDCRVEPTSACFVPLSEVVFCQIIKYVCANIAYMCSASVLHTFSLRRKDQADQLQR